MEVRIFSSGKMRINAVTAWICQALIVSCALKLLLAEENENVEMIDTSPEWKKSDWLSTLDEKACGMRHSGCCEQMYMGDEDVLTKCFTLHQSKLPADDEKDPSKLAKFLSCLADCIFKQQKYKGKGDNINMKIVRATAGTKYADRPKEKEYHIKMYDFCRKDALKLYNLIKLSPAGLLLLKDACKPYFLFVLLCLSDYPQKHSCPYFMWEGKPKTSSVEECKEGREICYKKDGIPI